MGLKATFELDWQGTKYAAVLPQITNIYGPEATAVGGWQMGFKFKNGVFEYFEYHTEQEAQTQYERLRQAIDDYYLRTVDE